jgi:hypothetical protein
MTTRLDKGNLAEIVLRYNLANTRYELLNPATVVTSQIGGGAVTNVELANMAAWTFKGNNTSGSAAPSDFTIDALTAKTTPLAADEVPIWDAAGTAMKKATLSTLGAAIGIAPTVQRFTSGSGTYTPTSGAVRGRVRMCGSGGGGAADVTKNGSGGNTTTFGSWTALGGGGGTVNTAGGSGGSGGSNGTGTLVTRLAGGSGTGSNGLGGSNGFNLNPGVDGPERSRRSLSQP